MDLIGNKDIDWNRLDLQHVSLITGLMECLHNVRCLNVNRQYIDKAIAWTNNIFFLSKISYIIKFIFIKSNWFLILWIFLHQIWADKVFKCKIFLHSTLILNNRYFLNNWNYRTRWSLLYWLNKLFTNKLEIKVMTPALIAWFYCMWILDNILFPVKNKIRSCSPATTVAF